MLKLFFPSRNEIMSNPQTDLMSEEYLLGFRKVSDDLEERAEQMAIDCCTNPDQVSKKDIVALAKDTYTLTVQLFDAKKARGETLLREEIEIYNLCVSEIQKYSNDEAIDSIEVMNSEDAPQPVDSILGALFNAVELIRNCIEQVKDWFNLTTEKDKADQYLVSAGNTLLPAYCNLIKGFFTTIAELFMPIFSPTLIGIAEAQAECALHYQDNKRNVNKQMASDMLDIADYAYGGHSKSKQGEFQKLSTSEIPQRIRLLYDEKQGLLSSTRGLRVWLGKKDGTVVVSYSGTDFKNFDMVYADIIQLSQPSILYLKAAGLLKILLDNIPGKPFFVTGHSLGGGLSQFSLTANMGLYPNRLSGYGYNPAGLSMTSIKHLNDDRLKKAAKNMWIFMTCYDPVSAVGGKIGCLTTLPKTDKNGHGVSDLKVCMKKYLETPQPSPLKTRRFTWRNHIDNDFIPYTKTLSFADENGTVYPVFNGNISSSTTDLISFDLAENLFSQLNFSTSKCTACMGIYNKFNGTAHTVMNRMLLLTQNKPTISVNSVGNIHSSMIYGKFGLGIKDFIKTLQQAYADSGEAFAGSPDAFQEMLANLSNPFEYDKEAWCCGIKLQFGIDMNTLFSRWPLAEQNFDMFLNNLTADRIDLYNSVSSGKDPDKQTIKSFLSGYKDIVVKHATVLMNEAVKWNVITQANMDRYMNEIKSFADSVINRV